MEVRTVIILLDIIHENIIQFVHQIPYSCNWTFLDEEIRDNQERFYKNLYITVFVQAYRTIVDTVLIVFRQHWSQGCRGVIIFIFVPCKFYNKTPIIFGGQLQTTNCLKSFPVISEETFNNSKEVNHNCYSHEMNFDQTISVRYFFQIGLPWSTAYIIPLLFCHVKPHLPSQIFISFHLFEAATYQQCVPFFPLLPSLTLPSPFKPTTGPRYFVQIRQLQREQLDGQGHAKLAGTNGQLCQCSM